MADPADDLTKLIDSIAKARTAAQELKLAQVVSIGGGVAELQFVGEESPPSKAFKVVGYPTGAGDYVVCAPVGGSYVVLGKLGALGGGGIAGPHELLSTTHTDTSALTPPAPGDIIRANAGHLWERYSIINAGRLLIARDAAVEWAGGLTVTDEADGIWNMRALGAGATQNVYLRLMPKGHSETGLSRIELHAWDRMADPTKYAYMRLECQHYATGSIGRIWMNQTDYPIGVMEIGVGGQAPTFEIGPSGSVEMNYHTLTQVYVLGTHAYGSSFGGPGRWAAAGGVVIEGWNASGSIPFQNSQDLIFQGYYYSGGVHDVEFHQFLRPLNIAGAYELVWQGPSWPNEADSMRLSSTGILYVDKINENVKRAGVTVEGTLLKDNYLQLAEIATPTIPGTDDQVDASADDAWQDETDGTMDIDDHYLTVLAYSISRRWAGFRFHKGPWPAKGSKITVAYAEIHGVFVSSDDARLYIHAEKAASPSTFTTGAFNITNRPRTTAYAEWVDDWLYNGGFWTQTPSLVSVIQELVDAYDITSLALIFRTTTGSLKSLAFDTWDEGDHSFGVRLHLEWEEQGVAPANTVVVYAKEDPADSLTKLYYLRPDGAEVGPLGAAAGTVYTPATLANWNGGVDPGNVDDALDQLAARIKALESA